MAGIVVLVLVVLAAALAVHELLGRRPASSPPDVSGPEDTARVPCKPPKPGTLPAGPPAGQPVGPPRQRRPLVALIIDDMGYDHHIAESFLSFDAPLTFSILPHSPFQSRIAQAVHAGGREIMLHLPMEPEGYPRVNPGPGTLLTTMTNEEFNRQLQSDLNAVAYIRGVNNHMGSKMSADVICMNRIFGVLAASGLYFIDSRSTSSTVCRKLARRRNLPFAERDIFLDHHTDIDFMRQQLRRLIQVARRRGAAVAIAHPHHATLQFMRQHLPQLNQQVQLVPASALVRPGGVGPKPGAAHGRMNIRTLR